MCRGAAARRAKSITSSTPLHTETPRDVDCVFEKCDGQQDLDKLCGWLLRDSLPVEKAVWTGVSQPEQGACPGSAAAMTAVPLSRPIPTTPASRQASPHLGAAASAEHAGSSEALAWALAWGRLAEVQGCAVSPPTPPAAAAIHHVGLLNPHPTQKRKAQAVSGQTLDSEQAWPVLEVASIRHSSPAPHESPATPGAAAKRAALPEPEAESFWQYSHQSTRRYNPKRRLNLTPALSPAASMPLPLTPSPAPAPPPFLSAGTMHPCTPEKASGCAWDAPMAGSCSPLASGFPACFEAEIEALPDWELPELDSEADLTLFEGGDEGIEIPLVNPMCRVESALALFDQDHAGFSLTSLPSFCCP